MATSGVYTYVPTIAEIIEEAYELAGLEMSSGYDAVSARRSLNFSLMHLANEGINMWTIEQVTVDLVDGTASYNLESTGVKTVDVLDVTVKDGDTYTDLARITWDQYLRLPDKTIEGRPSQFAVVRGQAQTTIYLYPVPDDSTLDLVLHRARYIQDVVTLSEDLDAPKRFIPAITATLAYFIAAKNPLKVTAQKRAELKMLSDEMTTKAKHEDRDRSAFLVYGGPKQ